TLAPDEGLEQARLITGVYVEELRDDVEGDAPLLTGRNAGQRARARILVQVEQLGGVAEETERAEGTRRQMEEGPVVAVPVAFGAEEGMRLPEPDRDRRTAAERRFRVDRRDLEPTEDRL